MTSLPWFLLAFGIVLVIVGSLLAVVAAQSRPLKKRRRPEPQMPHQEIRELLNHKEQMPIPNVVICLGVLCVFASMCWRLARDFR